MQTKKLKGYKLSGPGMNVFKVFDGFEVSYNRSLNETALIHPTKDNYYILTGDFRLVYESAKNFKEALTLFLKFADRYYNDWSTITIKEARAELQDIK